MSLLWARNGSQEWQGPKWITTLPLSGLSAVLPGRIPLYNGRKPGTAQRIVDMAFNGSGVRDTGRVLGISKNTVIRRLKKLAPAQVSSQQQAIADVAVICEMDEQ